MSRGRNSALGSSGRPLNAEASSGTQNQIEVKIAHSLSVHSLIQQVVATQKNMRRSAALLIAFTCVCAVLYLPVPGIAGVELGSLLGTKFVADSQAIRFIASIVLLYYIVIFGTNYYKGLALIEEADESISKRSSNLSDESRKNYYVSLSDNYLFDAMRRIIGRREDAPVPSLGKPSNAGKLEQFDYYVRNAIAVGVVVVSILFVLFGEYLVMIGLTGMGTELSADGKTVDITTFGFTAKIVVAIVFAVLSYLFFSYLAKLHGERNKNVRKKMLAIFAVAMGGIQASAMPLVAAKSDSLSALHYGCRLFEIATPAQEIKESGNVTTLRESKGIESKGIVCARAKVEAKEKAN